MTEVNKTHIVEPPPIHSNTASFSSKPPWVDQFSRRIGDIDIKLPKIDKISADLESVILSIDMLQKRVNNLESQSGKLRNTMEDLWRNQTRLFFGLAEHRGQGRKNWVNLNEDFYETELAIDGIGDSIERAYRIGKFNGCFSSRPVVGKFARFSDRERIRMSAIKLNKTYLNYL